MSRRISTAFTLALAFTVLTPSADARQAKKAGSAVLIPAADLKWADVPGFTGVQMAVVQGDPAKGPSHSMFKFKDGFASPLHHHSSDHYVTVVSGTLVLSVDGKETSLPAGSYFSFTGMKPHITRCAPGADCVLSMDARGKWDVVPEKAPAAGKK